METKFSPKRWSKDATIVVRRHFQYRTLTNVTLCKLQDYIETDFFSKCLEWRTKLATHLRILRDEASDGELAAFASYAVAFPDGFLALVDTYDVAR